MILCKHRSTVNRQRYNQVGFHLTLLFLPAMHLEVLMALCLARLQRSLCPLLG
jgi:hypothetical protein